ncbi:PREDICTED: nardilysin-like isoform X2 [Dinoponera quadriceps]|uniref:Nardilysin-like isoform X2 n=1 Tax=Dinoponera quadriceps TaxID=609295 RepID=A0A6P3XEV1_DINQU|nr:PREDICTED: nardilysin-like isoform X2 [Dinoponera quadriceps]
MSIVESSIWRIPSNRRWTRRHTDDESYEEDKEDEGDEEDEEEEGDEEDEDDDMYEGDDEEEGPFDDEEEGAFDDEDEDKFDKDDAPRAKRIKRSEKMAACAMSVGVGTFSDPPEIDGLAHFLEHMIFMGSEKYPKENDFDAYISKYGGYSNAVTGLEQTTFHFCIQQKHFLSALDRFAQFFIKPLMKKDAIKREREAVESEFQIALSADSNRKVQLQCSFAYDGHPVRKFGWGNLSTLRDNVSKDKLYQELHNFRERHYSAHRMRLAIQAKLPLDTLEDYVTKCFADIPNNALLPDDFAEFKGVKSFDTAAFPKMYKVKPIKDFCRVDLTWVMPSSLEHYKTKPHEYLSSIIGAYGKGSLMSYLCKKLWCIDICCNNNDDFGDTSLYSMFCLKLWLTDKGYENLEDVLAAVFSFINLVKREGPQKRFYEELQQIEQTNFRFLEEQDAEDYVVDMSENMFFYPPRDYITGDSLFFEYDADAIQMCMDCLVPDKVNIIVYDKNYNEQQFDKIEPWFKTKYMEKEIPSKWTERWKDIEPFPDFHLPLSNMFLVDDFSMISLPAKVPHYPEIAYRDAMLEIWYRPDCTFGLPECYMSLYFISDVPYATVKNAALMDLYVMILSQLMRENLHPAAVVGYTHQIMSLENGAVLHINGFNEKLPLLLTLTAEHMVNFPNIVTKDMFKVMRTHLAKHYYNAIVKPKNLSTSVRVAILMKVYMTDLEKHSALQDVSFDDLLEFVRSYTSQLYIQCLVQGNMTQAYVVEKIRECFEILQCKPLPSELRPRPRVMKIPLGVRCCKVRNLNTTDVNSVVLNYYQIGVESDKEKAMINLLLLMMAEPMFDQLRTKEQLGYDIHCSSKNTNGILGFSIKAVTQADKYTTEYVDVRIEEFIKSFAETIEKTTEDELNSFKETLKKKKLCADVHLKQEFDRNWDEIENEDYMFDMLEREVVALQTITLGELKDWYAAYTQNGPSCRKLSVHVVGRASNEATPVAEACINGPKHIEAAMFNGVEKHHWKTKHILEYVPDEQSDENRRDNSIANIEDFKRQLDSYPAKPINPFGTSA